MSPFLEWLLIHVYPALARQQQGAEKEHERLKEISRRAGEAERSAEKIASASKEAVYSVGWMLHRWGIPWDVINAKCEEAIGPPAAPPADDGRELEVPL